VRLKGYRAVRDSAETANISYHSYQSGHMVYLNEDVLKQFHADVAAFIRGTENGK
jgi:hypothetical protein